MKSHGSQGMDSINERANYSNSVPCRVLELNARCVKCSCKGSGKDYQM